MAKDKIGLKESSVEYLLDKITTIKFGFEPINDAELRKNYLLDYNILPSISRSTVSDHILIRLIVEGIIKQNGVKVISLEVLFEFKINNGIDLLLPNGKNKNYPFTEIPQTLITFLSITLSTTRGILLEKLKGTIYHHKFIPVMDPKLFFVNPLKADKIKKVAKKK